LFLLGVCLLGVFGTSIGKAVANTSNGFDAIRELAEFATERSDVHVDSS
jgi:hypothetical protein